MARTITVTDDDSDMVTIVVVDKTPEGFSTVRQIRFESANGGGLGTPDLSVLRDFGLIVEPVALPAPGTGSGDGADAGADDEADGGAGDGSVQPPPAAPTGRSTKRRTKAGSRAAARRAVATRPADRAGRGYRKSPEPEELQRLFTEQGGPSAVARYLDVPVHSVQGWLRRHRAAGWEFSTTG